MCVQYRCRTCGYDCVDEMEHIDIMEPVWADGTIAVITQNKWCDRCIKAIAEYEAENRRSEPWAYEDHRREEPPDEENFYH
jgi:hypothetical protein